MRLVVLILIAASVKADICLCAQDFSVGEGEVELLVHGADGRPLSNSTIEVAEQGHHASSDGKSPYRKVETDEGGRAKLAWPEGLRQFAIQAQHFGYGQTGLLQVARGKTTHAEVPPLAPFGVLEGTIEGWRPGIALKLWGFWGASVDASPEVKDGAFRVELPGNRYGVRADEGKTTGVATLDGGVQVTPGERVHVVLHAVSDEKRKAIEVQEEQTLKELNAHPGEELVAWAQGTIKDESGKPVAGANVYAVAVYHGRIRMYEDVKKAVSDDNGHYVVKGIGYVNSFSATLVAQKSGTLSAWGWIQELGSQMDFVLPSRGGNLDVAVVRDGKPANGISVVLLREGGNLREIWAAGGGSDIRSEVEEVAEPSRMTARNGVAHFEQLLPGLYSITAAQGPGEDFRRRRAMGLDGAAGEIGNAEGVVVRTGETTSHRMTMLFQPEGVPVRVVRHDGDPLTGNVALDFGRIGGGGWSSGANLDADGRGEARVDELGLWREEFKYTDVPVKQIPLGDYCYCAPGVVAVSPLLASSKEFVKLTATRFEPGGIHVTLLGIDGKPASGVVEIGNNVGLPAELIGSVDEGGGIEFKSVHSSKYFVMGRRAGTKSVDLADWGGTQALPSDEELRGCNTFVPPDSVITRPNSVRSVVLRSQPAGYVRGTVTTPQGAKTQDYRVRLQQSDYDRGAQLRYRSDTGEFVAGPFAPGGAHIILSRHSSSGAENRCGKADAHVESGKVSLVNVVAAAVSRRIDPRPESVMLGVNGLTKQSYGSGRLKGKVLLPDGKTPAFGALLMYFEDGEWQPTIAGVTDSEGTIRTRGLWQFGNDIGETNDDPVVVAWLPGSNGAAITALNSDTREDDLKLVLPPSIRLKGKVTVGGVPPSGRPARIRVAAACQGRGRLNRVLSVQATAQEDGTFELAGLTPGAYRVQASLDDIWLSESKAVQASEGMDAVTLAIGKPGGPIRVKVIDAADKPIVMQELTIDRPLGPLTSFWPETWQTDGAGEVFIPALEAGRQTLHILGAAHEIEVQPLPMEQAAEFQIRIGAIPREH